MFIHCAPNGARPFNRLYSYKHLAPTELCFFNFFKQLPTVRETRCALGADEPLALTVCFPSMLSALCPQSLAESQSATAFSRHLCLRFLNRLQDL